MMTKDYVYLGLIAFAGLVFYLRGYCAGARKERTLLLMENEFTARVPEVAAAPSYSGPELYIESTDYDDVKHLNGVRPQSQEKTADLKLVDSVHCFFGNN